MFYGTSMSNLCKFLIKFFLIEPLDPSDCESITIQFSAMQVLYIYAHFTAINN